MRGFTLRAGHLMALAFVGLLAAAPAHAEKPSRTAGGGKAEKHQQKSKAEHGKSREREREHGRTREREQHGAEVRRHFDSRQRAYIREHYSEQYRGGHCPPGLRRKHNGCMAPGQARKWRMGQPLPRDVIFHNLEPTVEAHLGPPPQGYRYVRVASDILMIAAGTGLVVDAIKDLGR